MVPRVALLLAALVIGPGPARGETPAAWDPARTTSPATVAEAKALQAKYRELAERGALSTVSVHLTSGIGSGAIVSEDGFVVTVSHVTRRPGRTVQFALADGTVVRGKTLGLNVKTDTAMARITDPPPKDASWPGAAQGKWPALESAKAADLVQGQWVVSLGHPGGLRKDRPPTARMGRFDRAIKGDPMFRTDCPITGGDSGGPVLDLRGRWVGIHTRIGILVGITLHIPTETFRAEWDRLKAGEVIGKTAHADAGWQLDETGKELAVKSVVAGGPAEKAGLLAGDVLTAIDGEAVATADDVRMLLNGLDPDQVVPVVVRRGATETSLDMKLGKRP